MSGSSVTNEHAHDPLCGASIAQQQASTAVFGAPGEAFDSGPAASLLSSKTGGANIFAPAFGSRVETIDAMLDGSEPFIAGLPEDDPVTRMLAILRPGGVTHDVTVGPQSEFRFAPSTLTINVGDTVRWTWESFNHSVTSGVSCTADSQYCSPTDTDCPTAPTSSTGFVYTHTFDSPGTFQYYCSTHCGFGMEGTITVQGTPGTFFISGKVATGDNGVTTGGSTPVSDVTMTLSGSQTGTTMTDAGGNYSFANLTTGNYTVTPSHTSFTFTPVSRSYTDLSADQANQDFTASATTSGSTISGQVMVGTGGLQGVTMTLSGAQTGTTTTNASGNYSFTNLAAGNYTVTPSHPNYTFTPASRSYTNLSADQLNQNYTATPKLYSVSGQVTVGATGLQGVTMTLSGAQTGTTTTDASGNYSFASLATGNYTVTPSHDNYTFSPASRSYTNLSANQANQNFTATPEPLTISGQVREGANGLAAVTMTLTSPTPAGFPPRTVMTNSTGNYSFTNVPAGRNYTLTPSKSGFTFKNTSNMAQAFRSYTNLSADQVDQDFTATAVVTNFTISGFVKVGTTGLAAVKMTLTSPTPAGFTPRTVMTTNTGSFTFSNVPGGRNYTLTPSKTNYTFKNTSNTAQAFRSYTNLSANQTNQNFAATANSFTISGFVKVGTTGLAGVTMKLVSPTPAGFTPRTVMTTNTGSYSFTNVPGGRNYTLTPTKTNYTFKNSSNAAQAFRSYTNLSANQTNQNFAATLKTYTISGRVTQAASTTGISAVTMTLSSPTPAGFTPRTVMTNSSGGFSFTAVPGARNYMLKPTKTGFTFNPVSRSYTNLSANQTGAAASFTGTPTAPRPSSTVEFTESSYRVGEGDGHVEITVARSGDTSAHATVDYEVSDGTASDRSDYSTTLGTLRFDAGETSKSFIIFITDDAYQEGDETLMLTLSNGTNGVEAGNQSASVITITDNNDASAANPVDDPAFFVRQLYVDFLAREPRPEELSVLVDNLNRCVASDPACDPAGASARLLRSEEFRQRGYFIYRLYMASLGRMPLYREFMRDLQQVKGANGDDQLMTSQEAFMDEWVNRSEFKQIYDALPDRDYVARLSQTAGISITAHDAMSGNLESGSMTRAQVLREMIESAELARKVDESSSAIMLYFGHLRRDPDAEDINTLLDLMNNNPQAYRKAVEALINSAEYRSRFGQP